MKANDLIIYSNKSLGYIKEFIRKCVEIKNEDDSKDTNQYIYTYLGEDEDKNLSYVKELFVPFENTNAI